MNWCWLEDSNLPPLAYEASALPDELSQPDERSTRWDAAPLPGQGSSLVRRAEEFPGTASRNWTFNNVKEQRHLSAP